MSEVKATKFNEADLEKMSLNDLLKQLDEIVAWFNNGEVDVEQAAAKFDEGVKLAEVAKKRLSETENKVNQIKLKLEKFEAE